MMRRRLLWAAGAAGALVLLVSACSSAASPPASSQGGTPEKGGTATFGIIAGTQPNWIWPFVPAGYGSVYNAENFEELMFRPLYMFGNNGESVDVNYQLSPADPPVYSDGGKTVTIDLKGWKWSNGETVDAEDVAFMLNMMKGERANDSSYVPGTLPDNLASYSIPSANTIVLHLTKAYASTWFTYNQLAEITPMPMAWDITKVGAKPGSGGCHTTPSKCVAVYNFLIAQSKDISTYASNPLWSVVDGPWKLAAFSSDGDDTFVPNNAYSGSPKPRLSALKYVTYTSDTAEYTALRTGTLDVGQIPPADLPEKPASQALPSTNPLGSGYTLEPVYSYGISYFDINFDSPQYGAVLRQLYIRQALIYVEDQVGMSESIYRGYATPGTGPIPSEPVNAFEPAIQRANNGAGPYPFSIAKAKSLLESHGWKLVGGVMTCETPAKCGTGIKAGTKLTFTMPFSSGISTMAQQVDIYKSDAAQAGISISLQSETFNALIGQLTKSNPNWTLADYGGWDYNGPGFLPTGEPLFETNPAPDGTSYSNATVDREILAIQHNSSMTLFHQYATTVAEQLPLIWTPEPYGIQAVKSNLHGVAANPDDTFLPEYWYFTK